MGSLRPSPLFLQLALPLPQAHCQFLICPGWEHKEETGSGKLSLELCSQLLQGLSSAFIPAKYFWTLGSLGVPCPPSRNPRQEQPPVSFQM